MEMSSLFFSLIGGVLIGIAVSVMLLFNGRVTGVSGIIAASLSKPNKNELWRLMFLAGMIMGGIVMYFLRPDFFNNLSDRTITQVLVAGLLVGYGTVMGSGCTSGHGVCGVSRFSIRSVFATLTFMLFGFITVQVVRYFTGAV